jgi:ABC-type branched-subunit amino acid transport system ATPase component/ABC-type branched-subunit amino acid transport system permease subunit
MATSTGTRRIGMAGGAVALTLLPLTFAEATVYKLGLVLIVVVGAIGLHVLVNWTGELSLAHATIIGFPAFVVAKLSADHGLSPLYLLPIGVLAGAAVGAVVGLPALRARGLQVALVTLAAGVAIDRYFFTKTWFVGEAAGARVDQPRLGPVGFDTARSLYPVLVVLVLAAAAVAWMLYRSKLGRGLTWVKEEPTAAAAFGIPVARYKVLAYALAGAYAGFAGALTATWVQRVTPQAFPLTLSLTYLVIVVLGGRGLIAGVALAAAAIEGGRLFLPGADALIAYGAPIALIFTLTRYRGGLNGALDDLGRLVDRLTRRRVADVEPPPAVVTERPAPVHPLTPARPLLEVRDARISFGGLNAVDGASLRVDEGSIVGLIGPNGAGKTTLFNGITGVCRLDSGRVVFRDRDVTRLAPHVRARLGIGRSFQNLGLMMPETVERNVAAAQHLGAGYAGWDLAIRPARVWRGERRIAERTTAALEPFGLAHERARPVEDLSFAAARFVELAAVLVEAPKLMLLDEPTTGLDAAEVVTLVTTLERLRAQGTTILVIAHDVGFVMQCCDHVYVLAEGRILSEGPPEMVQREQSVIDAYLGVSA